MIAATPEDMTAAYSVGLDTYFTLTRKAFEGVEKLLELNLNVAKATLQESAGRTREFLSLKDPQDLLAFQAAEMQPTAEKALAYFRHVYDIATQTQSEFTRLAETQLSESNHRMVSLIDSASKNAPAGSETAVALVKSALAAASSAYDSINKAAKQAVEMAEANVTAATNAAVKTATQAAANGPRAKKSA